MCFFSEIKPYAIKAYKGFYGENEIINGDITQVKVEEIPDFDFYLLGFHVSLLVLQEREKVLKIREELCSLKLKKILKGKIDAGHPAMGFLLENVEGLINHDGGETLKTIINHLEALGYMVSYRLLDSKFFGLPQSRKKSVYCWNTY